MAMSMETVPQVSLVTNPLSAPHDGIMEMEGDTSLEPSFSYDDVFPALPETEIRETPINQSLGQWNQKMKVRTSDITQVFRVPVEERRFREISSQRFGEQGEQAKICADIMQETGAHIEISSSKDQSLTILVTGKEEAVLKARRQIVNKLQTQANGTISIPKEHHKYILGKSGKKLTELELQTSTKIQMPRVDENSDLIRIIGTKEGIEKARHEIQLISDEQAKHAFERLSIPKNYHPFIAGPFNETVNQLMNETGVRINIPPVSVQKNELTVAGEKEAVAKAVEAINRIYEEKKKKCQTVSVEVKKNQHKYIVGPRGQTIQEILAETGVSVEMPPSNSDSETITLRGEQEKLGPALTLLYEKANSFKEIEIDAPSWLHKFIIGPKGANIKQLTQNMEKVHIEFTAESNKIKVDGPKDEVEEVQKAFEDQIRDLLSRLVYEEIKVEPNYHRHVIGKGGANVNRIKQETGVMIQIPSDGEMSNIIRIEGPREAVTQAKKELEEIVQKVMEKENEVTKELMIEQRFHRTIIGTKGDKIREIREQFNQVNIAFPEPGVKSDKVIIRGPKQDVEDCYKYLSRLNKELITNNYREEVRIYKQFHKFIIGKGGNNIRKIRDDTDTKIDLPAEGNESNVIVITGKKENVQTARNRILAIQKELDNIMETELTIPPKFHNSIIGAKGRLIRSIMEECGGVVIRFPQEGSGSDKVLIRGVKEDVEKAKKQLTELANEKQQSGYTIEVKAKPEHHRFLIGRNGANIKKVRDKTGARIIFPSEKDDDRDTIVIIGKKEAAQQAQKELMDMIKNLDQVIEKETTVPPKHHRHFVARKGEVLKQIADEYGGVSVSFPRNGEDSDRVKLKGAKEFVEGAIQRIQEIVQDLESQVTIVCVIPQQEHRTVMGAKGYKVQDITQRYNVEIKFPDKDTKDKDEASKNSEEPFVNGEVPVDGSSPDGGSTEPARPRKADIIYITGKPENCEAAKAALLALVPITCELDVPYDLHRYIIGQKGKDVREMMETYDVNIAVPPVESHSDTIIIKGVPANVEQAKEALLERVKKLEEERQERTLRNFKLTVEVDPRHHPKIIGRKGAVISKIRKDHGVQIQFPERGDQNERTITIIGYEKNAEAARDDILKIVKELEDMVTVEIEIDHRVHSRLIGSRGWNIRKIMEDYKVDIRFPRPSDENPNLVTITGMEELIEDAKEHLLNLEDEFLQDVRDYDHTAKFPLLGGGSETSENSHPKGDSRGFVVKGGPWEQHQTAPDTTNQQEFPSFGSQDVPKPPVAWGPRR